MQREITILAMLLLLLLLLPATLAFAQSGVFSLDWWTVDSGGGTSTGGGYTVFDTVGQPDAGDMTGGGYTLAGGFWDEEASSGTLYLPILLHDFVPCNAAPDEQEPNNTASQANPICLGSQVAGAHDGSQGTGDVFKIYLTAGQSIEIALDTANENGVQLLLYFDAESGLSLVGQDTISPFLIHYTTQGDGWYFIYVYSDAGTNNTGAYTVQLSTAAAVEQMPLDPAPAATPPPTPRE